MSTKYAVLTQVAGNSTGTGQTAQQDPAMHWKSLKMIDAISAKVAVAAVVKELGLSEGTFVAVPVRSWKQVKVKAENKPVLTFS